MHVIAYCWIWLIVALFVFRDVQVKIRGPHARQLKNNPTPPENFDPWAITEPGFPFALSMWFRNDPCFIELNIPRNNESTATSEIVIDTILHRPKSVN